MTQNLNSIEEYIVTEKNENIKSLRIEVFENNQYKGITRNIGTHLIDLKKEEITCKNKNEIVEGAENVSIDYDTKGDILVEDIKYFDIEIDEKYDYEIFSIVVFKDKNLYDIYYEEQGIRFVGREAIVIEENSEYKLALFMNYGVGKIENIKDIVDTIKLKDGRDITQKEAIEILEKLYSDARAVYLEVEFEYKDELETVKCKNFRDEDLELECYQIMNYNEILDKVFTENGKKQYEEKSDIRADGRLIYTNEKVYGGMFGDSGDITYETTEFINIEIESNTISCIARNIYSDERDNIEANFIIKNIDGQ